jgi:hypothetical protein
MFEPTPDYVYKAPNNEFTPQLFVTNNFGFSASLDPFLYPSVINTVVSGADTRIESLKGDYGFYLNINAESKVGAGNDFYSFYGLASAKFGVNPTFNGSQYALGFGGGIDFGIKNVKLFGQYKYNLMESKSYLSSDVEESGEVNYDISSTELNYGLKFTFGGNETDNYRRTHISLGILEKTFDFEGTSDQYYYDFETKNISKTGTPLVSGYFLEWKQDNTFSLFFKFYPTYNYAGDTKNIKKLSSTLDTEESYFELGFLRAFDFF